MIGFRRRNLHFGLSTLYANVKHWRWAIVILITWMEWCIFIRDVNCSKVKILPRCLGGGNIRHNWLPSNGLNHSTVVALGDSASLQQCIKLCCGSGHKPNVALYTKRQCYGVKCNPLHKKSCGFIKKPNSNTKVVALRRPSFSKRAVRKSSRNKDDWSSIKLTNVNSTIKSTPSNHTTGYYAVKKMSSKKNNRITIKLDHKSITSSRKHRKHLPQRTTANATSHSNLTTRRSQMKIKRQSLLDDPRFKDIPRTYIRPINRLNGRSSMYNAQSLSMPPHQIRNSKQPLLGGVLPRSPMQQQYLQPMGVVVPRTAISLPIDHYSAPDPLIPKQQEHLTYPSVPFGDIPQQRSEIPRFVIEPDTRDLARNGGGRDDYSAVDQDSLSPYSVLPSSNFTMPQSILLREDAAFVPRNKDAGIGRNSELIKTKTMITGGTQRDDTDDINEPDQNAVDVADSAKTLLHSNLDNVNATVLSQADGEGTELKMVPTRKMFVPTLDIPIPETSKIITSRNEHQRTGLFTSKYYVLNRNARSIKRKTWTKTKHVTIKHVTPSSVRYQQTNYDDKRQLLIVLNKQLKTFFAPTASPVEGLASLKSPGNYTVTKRKQERTETKRKHIHKENEPKDEGCWHPLGLNTNKFSDNQFTASSQTLPYSPSQARINDRSKGWCSNKRSSDPPYLQIDFGSSMSFCRISTKGQSHGWTKRFTLGLSPDGRNWRPYKEKRREKEFTGNNGDNDTTSIVLKHPVITRFVRFHPTSWQGLTPCLKVELYNDTSTGSVDFKSSRSAIPGVGHQGLIEDLGFEKMDEDIVLDQSPMSSNGFLDHGAGLYDTHSSCRHAAVLQHGGDVLIDGKNMRVKPKDAITVSVWVALDDVMGTHSIFDTIGGHSMHQQGQFHFEVVNGMVRWFHRNETGYTIFNVTTDPAAVIAKNWHSLVATYDAAFQLAKIYVNGSLRGLGNGRGFISQDWDQKVGVGRHKDGRYLNGYVDEFKIFDEALSEDRVVDLAAKCDFKTYYCGATLNAEKGLLVTPDFPLTHKGPMLCIWEIEGKPGEIITLDVKEFDLGGDGDCSQSTLEVRDSEHEALIGSYCGSEKPRVIESHGHRMWIKYTSLGNKDTEKFKIVYGRENKLSAKKTLPVDQCYLTRTLVNVTLYGGAKAGNFTDIGKVRDISDCADRCCARDDCDMGFMIEGYCYSVACYNADLCKTRSAKSSTLFPTVALISRNGKLPLAPQVDTTPRINESSASDVNSQCDHSETFHNVTLVGGIKAGNFTSKGRLPDFDTCLSQCCADQQCDAAFMVKGTCFSLQCSDPALCAMKSAKPSSYNPTIAYVHRNQHALQVQTEDPTASSKSIVKPSVQPKACSTLRPSKTFRDVTLKGGINAGEFVDKGKVFDTAKCLDYCCRDDGCNLAFVIRKTCFLVKCKSYESCALKPAVSRFYTPTVTYVNWNPPKENVGDESNRYDYQGCWRDFDMSAFALPLLEGTDPLISGPYKNREDPVNDCATVTQKLGYKVFAIQNGGACFSGSDAITSYKRYGGSTSCKGGRGGPFANSVYKLFDDGSVISLGCWSDLQDRAFSRMEKTDVLLQDDFQKRQDPVGVCAKVARKQSMKYFALQKGGQCFAMKNQQEDYRKYGMSRKCRYGLGGQMANDVYALKDVAITPMLSNETQSQPSLNATTHPHEEVTPAPKQDVITATSKPTVKRTTSKRPVVATTMQPVTVTVTKSPLPTLHNDTFRNKTVYKEEETDAEVKTYTFSVGQLQENVTMSRGINAGTYDDKGTVDSFDQCIHACGVEPACNLAFMLGPQCFSVSCYSDETCNTKQAFSSFYNPKIVFVKHEVSSRQRMQGSTKTLAGKGGCPHIHKAENLTLVAGIHAGNFSDLGVVSTIDECVSRCCNVSSCEIAFKIERDCYGITCNNKDSCKTRPARNSAIFTPIIAYVRPITNKKVYATASDVIVTSNRKHETDQSASAITSNCSKDQWEGEIRENETLIGGIKAGDFKDHGERSSIGDCMSECCKEATCDLAFMIDKDCYSVRCYNPDMCNTRAAKPTKFHPVIAYKKKPITGLDDVYKFIHDVYNELDHDLSSTRHRQYSQPQRVLTPPTMTLPPTAMTYRVTTQTVIPHPQGILANPMVAGSLLSSEVQAPTVALAIDGVNQKAVAENGKHSCSATKPIHNSTLKMGMHSGVFTRLGHVNNMDECIERCCKSSNIDVAYMLGLMCFSVNCYSPELCKTSEVMSSSIANLNMNPTISFLNQDKKPGLTNNGPMDDDDANPLIDSTDKQTSDNFQVANLQRIQTTKTDHKPTKTDGTVAAPTTYSFTPASVNPSDGGYTTYDTCQDSPVTYNVTLRGGINAGNFTEQGEGLTMNECIGKCCDATVCDLAFMFSDKCYSVTCFREDLCQAAVAKPSSLEPKIAYLSKNTKLNYIEDAGTSFEISSSGHETCDSQNLRHGPIHTNKSLAGGMEAGNFSFLGRVSGIGDCLKKCCDKHTCDVAYVIDGICFAVDCFSKNLCEVTANSDVKSHVVISALVKEQHPPSKKDPNVGIYILIGVIVVAVGSGGILWAMCMYLKRKRIKARQRDSESEESPMPDR